MSNDAVVNLLAKRFIQRKDAKAVQVGSGGTWILNTVDGKRESARLPWDRASLNAHVEGKASYGHYLLDTESNCKLFVFDIDLNKTGRIPSRIGPNPGESDDEIAAWEADFIETPDLRGVWRDRASVARPYLKRQFREIGHLLARGIYESLGLPCAVAYSGNKGIHVYGFTGPVSAADAREGARIVLDSIGGFKLVRGVNFYEHTNWANLGIEVFPKQDSLDGKDLGNLVRLPLGRNFKNPADPTFFLDLTAAEDFKPVDSEWALTTDNPWKRPGE